MISSFVPSRSLRNKTTDRKHLKNQTDKDCNARERYDKRSYQEFFKDQCKECYFGNACSGPSSDQDHHSTDPHFLSKKHCDEEGDDDIDDSWDNAQKGQATGGR